MIEILKADLLSNTRGVIVHGCNAQGVMGSGVAAGVRARFPEAYRVYREAYLATGMNPITHGIPAGELNVMASSDSRCHLELGTITFAKVMPELWIVNGITQDFYGRNAQCFTNYDAVEQVFARTLELLEALDPNAQADLPLLFPKIGAGRGGGEWDKIAAIIEAVVPKNRRKVLFVVDEEPIDCR